MIDHLCSWVLCNIHLGNVFISFISLLRGRPAHFSSLIVGLPWIILLGVSHFSFNVVLYLVILLLDLGLFLFRDKFFHLLLKHTFPLVSRRLFLSVCYWLCLISVGYPFVGEMGGAVIWVVLKSHLGSPSQTPSQPMHHWRVLFLCSEQRCLHLSL